LAASPSRSSVVSTGRLGAIGANSAALGSSTMPCGVNDAMTFARFGSMERTIGRSILEGCCGSSSPTQPELKARDADPSSDAKPWPVAPRRAVPPRRRSTPRAAPTT
jgi:hypothetical protein